MKQSDMAHRLFSVIATALVFAMLVPGIANATSIKLSGNVDNVQAFGGSPFSAGDPLSGMFNVNIGVDNTFRAGDLTSFSLTTGPAMFNLSSSDFPTFSGQLSADGTTLTDFAVLSNFLSVPGLSGQYALGFNGVDQPFSVTGFTSIVSGKFAATVGGGGSATVAEPSSLALFILATLALGYTVLRRRHGLADKQ